MELPLVHQIVQVPGLSDLRLVLLVSIWYAASSFCSVSSSFYLSKTGREDSAIYLAVSLLTLAQCLACMLGQWFQDSGKRKLTKEVDRPSSPSSRSIRFVGLLHFITTWAMNLAMAYSSLACAHSIRGLEPILAAILSWTYRSKIENGTSSGSHYASIAVIVAGVWLATWQDGQCRNLVFLIAGLSAGVCNVYRNILIQSHRGNAEEGFLFSAFAYSSMMSLTAISASILHTSSDWNELQPLMEIFRSPWLLAAGIGSMIYNTASIRVCVAVSLVSHSLLTVCKRPFSIITGAALTSGISQHMVVGNVLTAVGLYLYTVRNSPRTLQIMLFSVAALLFVSGIFHAEIRDVDWTPLAAQRYFQPSSSLLRTPAPLPPKAPGEAKTKLGLIYPLDTDPSGNYTENLMRSGANFGNRVWWDGTVSLFDHDAVDIKRVFGEGQGPFDVALFSTANIIWNETDYSTKLNSTLVPFITRLTGVLEKLEAPLIVVGLGTNGFLKPTDDTGSYWSDLQPKDHLEIDPQKEVFGEPFQRLMSVIQSRSRKFFVRGAYTAASMKVNGFTKAVSVGCPSLFISSEPHLGRQLETTYKGLRSRINDVNFRFILTLPGVYLPESFTMMLQILAKYPQSVIIIQDDRDKKNLEIAKNELTSISASTHLLAATQQRYFTSVQEWKEFYTGFDATFGWRIHGAMIGVASLVPSFLVAPDMRVLELAEAMLVPVTTPFDPLLSKDLDPIDFMAKKVKFDGKAFDRNRRQIANLYIEEFVAAGLQPSPALFNIVKEGR